MRDPERIDRIIARLRVVWKQNPDLRLGQIIGNAFSYPFGNDPYYVEDELFITALEQAHRRR